jgi:hypothetical protein
MGRAGGAAGLPVLAVALDDGGDVLGADAMKTQMKAAGQFAPFSACGEPGCLAIRVVNRTAFAPRPTIRGG